MKHGDANTYRKQACRCEPCRTANSRERAAYRKRVYLTRGPQLVDPTGTARRLQALAVMGWGLHALAAELDMHPHHVSRMRLGRRQVYRRGAVAVARVYERLCMTPGPDPKATGHALRMGWMPPLAWDDETIDDPGAWASPGEPVDVLPDPVAVDMLVAGAHWHDVPGVTRADRLAAAARLPVREAEARLGLRHGRDFGREAAA